MIRVADYIARRVEALGVEHVFMVSGGGAMHLDDAFGRTGMRYVCNHHEQACAMAAEGYARTRRGLGVAVVTSGPGGTNALTGVIGQWLDSVPVLYISGQVKFETTIASCPEVGLRQLGDQEINIVDIVRPVTKYAVLVTRPADVRKELEKAVYLATTGRPGPVWIDVPLNVQGASVDEDSLEPFVVPAGLVPDHLRGDALDAKAADVLAALRRAERPVLVAGHGIRIAGARDALLALVEKMGIPVVTTFCGFDLIPSGHPLFIGRIGTLGDRAGNFVLQNSDLALFVGTRNNVRQVSYAWQNYARAAKKIVVDIDRAELNKPTLIPDLPVHADAGEFLKALQGCVRNAALPDWASWVGWGRQRRESYPTVLPEHRNLQDRVHPYWFVQRLTELLDERAVVVAGNGTACVAMFQAGVVKEGQRLFWNSGCASMGYDLPAALGACFAAGRPVVCIAGDGSLQMNVQELQTAVHHRLPLRIFVLNNEGYASIRQTQDAFFGGHYVGCNAASGVSLPDFVSVAQAYGLQTFRLDREADLDERVKAVLACPGPCLCDVRLPPDYKFAPKLSSEKKPDGRIVSKPLEDMFPFLERSEFQRNMIIPPLEE